VFGDTLPLLRKTGEEFGDTLEEHRNAPGALGDRSAEDPQPTEEYLETPEVRGDMGEERTKRGRGVTKIVIVERCLAAI
jgi:hypothetical protein